MPELRRAPSPDNLGLYVRKLLIALGVGALALLLFHWRHVVLLGFGACVVAVMLRALADPIRRRTPLGPGSSLGLAVLGVLAVFGAVIWFVGDSVSQQIGQLEQALPAAWYKTVSGVAQYDLGRWLLGRLHDATGGEHTSNFGPFAAHLARATGVGAEALGEFLVVVVAGVYFAAQPALYRDGLLKLIPARGRQPMADAVDESGVALRKWLLGTGAAMLAMGVLVAIGTALLGLPAPVALGLLSGIAEFVPIVGAAVSAVPAVVLAATQGADRILWTVVFYVAAHQFEGQILIPLIQKRVVEVPPALTLFAVLGFGVLFGPAGIIFATPLAVVAMVMIKRLYLREDAGEPTDVETATTPVGARGRI